jgi:hypothetical protein
MKLDAVLIGEAAAVRWALQVLCKAHHGAGGSVPTGDDALMGSVDVIVVPYDDGEWFCLHDAILSDGACAPLG